MRKALTITLLLAVVLPSMSVAGGWRSEPGHRTRQYHRPFFKPHTVIHHNHNAGAIAAGVLGGILTGVMLERILTPPPQRQPLPTTCCQNPPPYPAPRQGYPGTGDPYDQGFQQGYERGVERGRTERYEQGQQQGYGQGLDDAASGRLWASTGP